VEPNTKARRRPLSDRPKPARAGAIVQTELPTDRPPERIRLQRLLDTKEVEFWSVSGSQRHWAVAHDTYTACLVFGKHGDGLGRWQSRGTTRIVTGGCVQLMEPGESHRTVEVRDLATFFVAFWQPAYLARAAEELGVTGNLHFRLAQIESGAVSPSFARLAESVNAGDDRLTVEEHLASMIRDLLSHAAEGGVAQRTPSSRHFGVRRAIELMHACFRDTLSLDALATEAKVSKFHFAHCFREATGFAPHQQQKLLRIREARRLLMQGASVEEAAERAGFADGPHLTRAFRASFGIAPGALGRTWRPLGSSLGPSE
jgi:AraC-like DNA-binding protein